VDKVLVDRRQLGREHLVEQLEDILVTSHECGSLGDAETARRNHDRGDVLAEQLVQGRVAPVAAGAGTAAGGELVDRGRAVLDLPAHAPLADAMAQAGDHWP
jgi:hypothetical protein